MTPEQLKARREKLGLSQVALAEKLGVSQGWVSVAESGKAPLKLWLGLALETLERRTH